MKKLLLPFLMLFVIISMKASGVYRFPIIVNQSDGTNLTIIAHGDENFHWITTMDGVIVIKNGDSFYVADIDCDGKLTPSTQLAHNKENRTIEEEQVISLQNRLKFNQLADLIITLHHLSARKASIDKKSSSPYTPHIGNVRGIVILAETADTAFSLPNPKKSFEYYLNGESNQFQELVNGEKSNRGCVNKYFNDISFGKFNPTFDVYGPVKVKERTSYYSKDRNKLVEDACKAADELINFASPIYDSDGDGYVDVVCVIYAGYGSNILPNPDWWIWPASSTCNVTFDGAKLSRYLVCNELFGYWGVSKTEPYYKINGIGLFCHEFSHCLGLPDFYPTNTYARVDNQEMEYWDLMDGGEYLKQGYCPPPYTAWERETMGWISIDTLTTNQKGIRLSTVDKDGKAYRFINPNDPNKREHFMLENIQNEEWNEFQKGHGLLVYHVNYGDFVNSSDHPNNTRGLPHMAVVPADGLLLSSYVLDNHINPETNNYYTQNDYFRQHEGDPFPGSNNVTVLKYDMNLPNYKWQIGENEVKQSLSNIKEDTELGIITFDFIADIDQDSSTPLELENNFILDNIDMSLTNSTNVQKQNIYTIDGRMMNSDIQLPKGVYIQGKRKFVVR